MDDRIFILAGSNEGTRRKVITEAVRLIGLRAGEVIACSAVYESDPWGYQSDSRYLNQAIEIRSALLPEELLTTCLKIESELGRSRSDQATGYQDRIIDIDILLIGDRIIRSAQLEIPHPRMGSRRFTLVPLAEIAADYTHPVEGRTIGELLAECDDDSEVYLVNEDNQELYPRIL